MRIGFYAHEGKPVALTVDQGGYTASGQIEAWAWGHVARVMDAGRRHRVTLPSPVVSSPVPAVPQDDGTTLVDLSGKRQAGYVAADTADGRKVAFIHSDPIVALGWPAGEHWYLQTDENGLSIVEPGRNHRKFYVTAGAHGLTRAEIATAESLTEAEITDAWLVASSYGRTPETALEAEVGRSAFRSVSGTGKPDASHWILFERGYTYTLAASALETHARGESFLHPLYMGAWGTGADPIMMAGAFAAAPNRPPTLFFTRGLDIRHSISGTAVGSVFVEDCSLAGGSGGFDPGNRAKFVSYRRLRIYDRYKTAPAGGATTWSAHRDREGAFYIKKVTGFLIDECTTDLSGWQPGYNPDGVTWNNGEFGQPPTMYSHGFYIEATSQDCFVRRTWSSRGSSHAFMFRNGANYIDNIAANSAMGFQHGAGFGNMGQSGEGNMSLLLGNLVENGAGRPTAQHQGEQWAALSMKEGHSLVDNIITHPFDPHNAAEYPAGKAAMTWKKYYGEVGQSFHDDTINYGWGGNQNLAVTTAQADATTIGKYFQTVHTLGDGTLESVWPIIRAEGAHVYIEDLLKWYRTGFGLVVSERVAATTLDFVPDTERADGFQWFNRLNWSTVDLPGTVAGDSVDLKSNFVRFGNETCTLANVHLGTSGTLDVVSGRLTATGISGGGQIMVRNCGQFYTSDGNLTGIEVGASGGRLNLQAATTLDDVTIHGRSEVLFGPDCTLPAGKTLTLESELPFVGWDGTGTATLTLLGTLLMRAAPRLRSTVDNNTNGWHYGLWNEVLTWGSDSARVADVSRVSDAAQYMTLTGWTAVPPIGTEFNAHPVSLIHGSMPKIARFRSGMNGDTDPTVTPTVALSGPLHLDLTAMAAGTFTLIDAACTGTFSGLTVSELDPGLDATVTVTGSGVTLTLAAGTGQAALA